jgi:hypothetical protein
MLNRPSPFLIRFKANKPSPLFRGAKKGRGLANKKSRESRRLRRITGANRISPQIIKQKRKNRNMKTSSKISLTSLALSVTFLASFAFAIKADEAVFKGGAQKLLQPPAAVVIPAKAKTMACPKCTYEWTARPIVQTKATAPRTEMIARHLCAGCETTITVQGHGKVKHDVVTHACNTCGAASLACCSTPKSM